MVCVVVQYQDRALSRNEEVHDRLRECQQKENEAHTNRKQNHTTKGKQTPHTRKTKNKPKTTTTTTTTTTTRQEKKQQHGSKTFRFSRLAAMDKTCRHPNHRQYCNINVSVKKNPPPTPNQPVANSGRSVACPQYQ